MNINKPQGAPVQGNGDGEFSHPARNFPLISADDYAYDEFSSDDESMSLVSNADYRHDHYFDMNLVKLKDVEDQHHENAAACCV